MNHDDLLALDQAQRETAIRAEVRKLVNTSAVSHALSTTWTQNSVYDIAHAAGMWDCDDVIYCECSGPHWHVLTLDTLRKEGKAVQEMLRHAALCAKATAKRAEREESAG
jgi:hypothetical protein